jgi:hypothetical protein
MEAQETGKADLVVDVHQTSYRYSSWFEIGGEAALYRRCSILRGSAQIRPTGSGVQVYISWSSFFVRHTSFVHVTACHPDNPLWMCDHRTRIYSMLRSETVSWLRGHVQSKVLHNIIDLPSASTPGYLRTRLLYWSVLEVDQFSAENCQSRKLYRSRPSLRRVQTIHAIATLWPHNLLKLRRKPHRALRYSLLPIYSDLKANTQLH